MLSIIPALPGPSRPLFFLAVTLGSRIYQRSIFYYPIRLYTYIRKWSIKKYVNSLVDAS